MNHIRIRRSVLFMPGSNLRALEKARSLPCDVVALDLEDSVAPDVKQAARHAVCAAIGNFGAREVVVRINALSTPWGRDDLAAVGAGKPDAIVISKVNSASDLVDAEAGIPLWAMIETGRAVLNLEEIAGLASVLVVGTNDLLNEMRALPMPKRENLQPILTGAVIAARAHGIDVIDGTYNAIGDDSGFAGECAQGRAFGFDGKTLIHPSQIETAHRVFAPGPDEIAQARLIVAAFERPENRDSGVVAINGRMIERLHAQDAKRILALADAIAARSA
jgi:citrate lyase subunit beta/citryl-CoA lyase